MNAARRLAARRGFCRQKPNACGTGRLGWRWRGWCRAPAVSASTDQAERLAGQSGGDGDKASGQERATLVELSPLDARDRRCRHDDPFSSPHHRAPDLGRGSGDGEDVAGVAGVHESTVKQRNPRTDVRSERHRTAVAQVNAKLGTDGRRRRVVDCRVPVAARRADRAEEDTRAPTDVRRVGCAPRDSGHGKRRARERHDRFVEAGV